MKEIDLPKILNETIINKEDVIVNLAGEVAIKEAMKRAISQALDIASEEAEVIVEYDNNGDGMVYLDKKSILDIKNRIK